jgi:hypothetical protein
MRYSLFFLFIGCTFIAYAQGLGLGWPLPLPFFEFLHLASVGFFVAGAAYLLRAPQILGKRPDGTRHWWAWPILWSYFLFTWAGWSGWAKFQPCKKMSTKGAISPIIPNLWISRRLTDADARAVNILGAAKTIIDLAPEFAEFPTLRAQPHYLSLPILDGTSATQKQLLHAVGHIQKHINTGVLVHCAGGHGRSAMVVAAYLLYINHAATPQEAIHTIKQARHHIKLNKKQLATLHKFYEHLKQSPPT